MLVESLSAQTSDTLIKKIKANRTWVESATKKAIPISSIKSDDFSDLMFLKEYISDKKIVFLGESLHGVNDFNVLKYRLIRFLHQEMNFNIIAFESGVHECGLTNLVKDSLNSHEIVAQSLKVIWWVNSNCEMMRYIKSNSMDIAGIDPNNVTFPLKINHYLNIFKGEKELAKKMYLLDSLVSKYNIRRTKYYYEKGEDIETATSLDSIRKKLLPQYISLKNEIIENKNINHQYKLVLKEAIDSKLNELSCSNSSKKDVESFFVTYEKRDSLMAENLEFLIDSLYPNQKIIVWAHNAHISKKGQDIVMNKGASIGMYLKNRLKKESYVIAIDGWGGNYSLGLEKKQFHKPNRKSLEAVLYNVPYRTFFLPVVFDTKKKEDDWLTKPIIENFNSYKNNVIKDKYDAIFFTKKTIESKLINYYKTPLNCD